VNFCRFLKQFSINFKWLAWPVPDYPSLIYTALRELYKAAFEFGKCVSLIQDEKDRNYIVNDLRLLAKKYEKSAEFKILLEILTIT
jgi:hypothetical protein